MKNHKHTLIPRLSEKKLCIFKISFVIKQAALFVTSLIVSIYIYMSINIYFWFVLPHYAFSTNIFDRSR